MPDTVPYLDENGKKQYLDTKRYIKRELVKELFVRDDISAALSDHSEEGLIPSFVREVNALHEKQETVGKVRNQARKAEENYNKAAVNSEILKLVDNVYNDSFAQQEKVFFGTVSNDIAEQIQELTGVNVQGFHMAVEARQISHILKDHGKLGITDHSMSNNNDVAKMEYTMRSPDEISYGGKTRAYSTMRNGKNRTADTVLYEKVIGEESYYVVQATPDTKAKTLYVVTAFIGKSGYKNKMEAPQLANAKNLGVTSEIESVVTSKSSISQITEKSNSSSENSSEIPKIRSQARDTSGNTLTSAQQEYFKDSKVRDSKGNLMVLYHGTTADFNEFKRGDVGFHFGTKGAARGRVGFGKNVTLKEVYLNITNPIVFDEDLGSWDADYRLTRELYDRGILTQAEAETVLLTDSKQYRRTKLLQQEWQICSCREDRRWLCRVGKLHQ